MVATPLRIVQISDTHLYADINKTLLGVNTQESFNVLLEMLKTERVTPDIILLTGDLSQDGSEASYRRLAEQLAELNVPVYCVPGNHDDITIMSQVYPFATLSMDKHIVVDNWQFILLDSHIHKQVPGQLDHSQFDFLDQCLQKNPKQHAIIAFHHHPVSINCEWLDKLGLLNADEFWWKIAKYPQIYTILFGHIHQQYEGIKNGIPYYSAPSTCIQFKANSAKFMLEKLPPAYRLLDLYPNGELKTRVCRAEHYVGQFKEDVEGY